MDRKDKIVKTQIRGIESLLKHHDINLIKGDGYITDNGMVEVKNSSGEKETIPYDKLIISTGSVPLNIPAFPFDGEHVISSNEALTLRKIPESIVIVGGGVIGCEFACILSAMGTKVTIVEALDRLLSISAN